MSNVAIVSGFSILDCPFGFSNVYICVVFFCFVCLRSMTCVPNVTPISGLSILYCLYSMRFQKTLYKRVFSNVYIGLLTPHTVQPR
jgi:hypothetical protein